ncbi:MAG: hypothetical protein KDC69_02075 [Flavobacteriaceae bacterium]|nr:hypothetical protein [Flavobacteriaceae bacterium]
MRSLLLLALLLLSQFMVSQELMTDYSSIDRKGQTANKKGQFFFSWGWNRDAYSKSNITFTGNDFNFTLYNSKADDKRQVFADGFKESGGLSLPASNQLNIKLGYFISDHFNIVLGFDTMKYVLINGQDGKISGEIATGAFSFEGGDYNYDGGYPYNDINYSRALVLFEHDGLNYYFVGVNRFDSLNELLNIRTDNFEIGLEEGIDAGIVVPKTRSKILNNAEIYDSNNSGFGFAANLGLNFTFFKYFFLKPQFKIGKINLNNLKITPDPTEKASQKFNFTQSSLSIGARFNLMDSHTKDTRKPYEPAKDDSGLKRATVDNPGQPPLAENDSIPIDDSVLETIKCPDVVVMYKEKFGAATDETGQKKYRWLALYYDYLCQCKEGVDNPDELVKVINNIVDSYYENVGGDHEKISKISKCRPKPTEKK